MSSETSTPDSAFDAKVQRLRQLRNAFLQLHKSLLDAERLTYEQTHGRIESNSQFFQLVIGDAWFDWLRPFSQFIVLVDETLASKDPLTAGLVDPLFSQAKSLLANDAEGSDGERKYHHAIQRDPDIAYLHVETTTLLRGMVSSS
jgi:hypothetical protein